MGRKFLATGFEPKGLNTYIGELLEDIIKRANDEPHENGDPVVEVLATDHMMLPQYVDIPRGIEGDHLIRDIVQGIEEFFVKITHDSTYFYEELQYRYSTFKPLEVTAVRGGIWVTL